MNNHLCCKDDTDGNVKYYLSLTSNYLKILTFYIMYNECTDFTMICITLYSVFHIKSDSIIAHQVAVINNFKIIIITELLYIL